MAHRPRPERLDVPPSPVGYEHSIPGRRWPDVGSGRGREGAHRQTLKTPISWRCCSCHSNEQSDTLRSQREARVAEWLRRGRVRRSGAHNRRPKYGSGCGSSLESHHIPGITTRTHAMAPGSSSSVTTPPSSRNVWRSSPYVRCASVLSVGMPVESSSRLAVPREMVPHDVATPSA